MPWIVRKVGNEYCLYKKDTGEIVKGSCDKNEQKVISQMRAMYANTPHAKQS